jgi:cytochrome c oxidase subunit 2
VPPALALAVAAACELPNFGAPDPASEEGESILSLWRGFFLVSIVVALLVYGLIVTALIRFRRRSDDVPDQKPYNVPLEIFYTATPVVVVAALFAFSWITENDVNEISGDTAVDVEVIGFQWSWQFVYPDEGITIQGGPGEPPELVLPLDQRAHLELTSVDVNHSFWTPNFLSKRDLIPGVDNEIEVTPNREGSYVGRCAEFCGLDHWAMYYSVRVVPQDEYDAWVADRRAEQADDPDAGRPQLPESGDQEGESL